MPTILIQYHQQQNRITNYQYYQQASADKDGGDYTVIERGTSNSVYGASTRMI